MKSSKSKLSLMHRKPVVVVLICCMMFVYCPFTVQADVIPEPELMSNGGFELGDPSPDEWDVFVSGDGAWELDDTTDHSGERSLQLTKQGDSSTAYAETNPRIAVQPGGLYELSVFYKASLSAGNGLVKLEWQQSNGTFISQETRDATDQASWQQITFQAAAPEGAAYALIQLQLVADSDGTVWYDDVSLQQVFGLVSNGGFEIGDPSPDDWDVIIENGGDGTWELDDTTDHSGERSLQLTKQGGSDTLYAETNPRISVEAGGLYELSVYYKASLSAGKGHVKLEWQQSNGTFISQETRDATNQASWQQITFQAAAPEGAAYALIQLQLVAESDGTVWYDDVSLQQVFGLVSNGGFEIGVPTPDEWDVIIESGGDGTWELDDTTDHSGERSLQLTKQGGSDTLYAEIDPRIAVQPGGLYELSVFYKASLSAGKGHVKLEWQQSNGTFISQETRDATNQASWQQITFQAAAPEGAAYALIQLQLVAESGGTIWYDDVSLQQVFGLVSNGGFEIGAPSPDEWDVIIESGGDGIWELDDTTAHIGARSLQLTKQGGSDTLYAETDPRIAVQPGGLYELSVYYKASLSSGKGHVKLEWQQSNGTFISQETRDATNQASWQQITFPAMAPEGAAYALIQLQLVANSDGTIWYDDVSLHQLTAAKTRSTYYTTEKVENARTNITEYDWAENLKDSAVLKADYYLNELGLEGIWALVPPQSLPRSYAVNQSYGSAVTGHAIDAYGFYPYTYDPIGHPWKLYDPSADMWFPTNDFASYYNSGLDEHGIFDPNLADSQYLVNVSEPGEGATWGVDDGFGWIDGSSNRFTFIAYYTHWALWGIWGEGIIPNILNAMRDAYVYTGDVEYARAGTVLLDRIADVYPSLDTSVYTPGFFHNGRTSENKGKALGSIWEPYIVKDFLYAYDAFFPAMDDPDLIEFLSDKAEEYDLGPLKSSGTGIRKNIEKGIVEQIYPAVKNAQISSGNGYHQSSLALAAVVYDTLPQTKEWLDFNFQSGGLAFDPLRETGGNMGPTFVNDVNRNGSGNEAAPTYNKNWLAFYFETANILDGYDLYPTADLYENPKFRKMFQGIYPLILGERYIPSIGDSGSVGAPDITVEIPHMVQAFSRYDDPVFAQMAYFLNNKSTAGLRGDIFSADPEQVAADIETVIGLEGELDWGSTNLTGYGFSALRDGTNPKEEYGVVMPFVSLPVDSRTAGVSTVPTNGALQFEATGDSDEITFTFDVTQTDEYEISIKPFRSYYADYGIYDVSVDSTPLGTIDFYGNKSVHEVIGTQFLTAGTHEITFANDGKNAASLGYKMGLFELALLDEAAQDDRDELGDVDTLRDVWMYYGYNGGHGHRDTLNLGLHAFGLDLAPDLGYPEYADATSPHRWEWMRHTISHNTVLVDESPQLQQWVAEPKHFDDSGQVKLIDVEAPNVYPQTDLYKRTTAMIRVDAENSYVVDFFRVHGGDDHVFSFHGAEGPVATSGLDLTPQVDGEEQYVGSYAGPGVEYGVRPSGSPGSEYAGPGFHFLKNVDRDDSPSSLFSVDWDVADTWQVLAEPQDIHLRLTMIGSFDDVALADGIPPQNHPGTPESLKYVLAHRSGSDIDSLFLSVIEPYKDERFIDSISPVTVKVGGTPVDNTVVKAVKIVLTNGRTDYVISSMDTEVTYTVDDNFQFRGSFGVYSEEDNEQVYGYVHDGILIGKGVTPMVDENLGRITGTIEDFTETLSVENEITVNMDLQGLNMTSLIGKHMYVANDGERNAVYEIKGITEVDDDLYTLDIGDITLIRRYLNDNALESGFVYDMAAEDEFVIPLAHSNTN